jgi:hypothetical protein
VLRSAFFERIRNNMAEGTTSDGQGVWLHYVPLKCKNETCASPEDLTRPGDKLVRSAAVPLERLDILIDT